MFENKDAENIMFESREALEKIKASKQISRLDEMKHNRMMVDRGKHFYEEFDQITAEGKIKVDMLYYNQFTQKLDQDVVPQVEQALISLYKEVHKIYEFVNIRPEVYGNGIDVTILDSSIEDTRRKLSRVVYEYLDNTFYKLSPTQRKTRYFEEHKDFAKQLITDGTNPEEAISFSIKSVVIENLLKNIAFPFGVWSRINYLTENPDYQEIFDRDKLVELVESFQHKLRHVARIISTCV